MVDRTWVDDRDEVLALGTVLVATSVFDRAEQVLAYFKDPDREYLAYQDWVECGRPTEASDPQLEKFVNKIGGIV